MRLVVFFIYMFISILGYGQVSPFGLLDSISINRINNINIEDCEAINSLVRTKMSDKKNAELDRMDAPRVFFVNRKHDKYFELTGGPDIGYCQYFTIGFTNTTKDRTGIYLGVQDIEDYVTDNEIRLGLSLEEAWTKASLQYFRSYTFNDIKCYYLEKGVKNPVPFVPEKIIYYKFQNNRLIEMGFGNALLGINPMLQKGKRN